MRDEQDRTSPELVDRLAAAPPFAGIRPETARAVVEHTRERRLQAGQTLVERGEEPTQVYVVVGGRLRVVLDRDADVPQELGTLEPGAVVGEIALLTGGRREATVVADTATTVLEVSAEGFGLLLEREPAVADRLAALAAARLRQAQLARQVARLFPQLDEPAVAAIVDVAAWVQLAPGERLVSHGEPADAAYVVVSGRLRVVAADEDDRGLADVGPGELVGEMALVEGGTRTATLVASRDSHVARLGRDDLLGALRGHPEAVLGIARTALDRAAGRPRPRGGERRAVALVAVHPSVDLPAIAAALAAALPDDGTTRLLTPDHLDEALGTAGLGRAAPDAPRVARITQWLQEQEQRHDTLLLRADEDHAAWSEVVLRHADHVALFADAGAEPTTVGLDGRIREVLRVRPGRRDGPDLVRRSLVLLHRPGGPLPAGTARWLAAGTVDTCHHVRQGHARDLARLARHLAEQPVGLVLSGGGARGFAHLGVVRALEEVGVPIDLVGGTSIGAVMGAFVALDLAPSERTERAKATLQGTTDWTLPLAGLVKGARMAERAQRETDGRDIEDLWLPWFAVSTNLTRAEVHVHRRGSVARALRATVAIPGIVPPVVYDGELHVDGGVLDNLPVEPMRRLNPRGPVIAVDVGGGAGPRVDEDFGLSVSGWGLAANRLLPGRTAPAVPGIATTLVRSMLAGSSRERERVAAAGLADLHLDLDLPPCGLLEFDAADRLIEAAYEAAAPRIRAWATTLPAAARPSPP